MKLKGILGKGKGKLGNAVFAVSGGVQIMREYNPNVSNPNTEGQVAQRAKLKLMSQIAAVLAPAFGFKKKGLVSARNQFVSKNIGSCTFNDNQAEVNVQNLQLTPSDVALAALTVTGGEGSISVALATAAAGDIKRVAYFVFKQNDDEQLEYVISGVVTEAGEGRTFPKTFNVQAGSYVVYAYGIKDVSVNATMRYDDYMNSPQSQEATLDVISLFRTSDYGLTRTSGKLVEVS